MSNGAGKGIDEEVMSIYSRIIQNVAPFDGIRMNLMIYTWFKG
jgi:hypothetical protein